LGVKFGGEEGINGWGTRWNISHGAFGAGDFAAFRLVKDENPFLHFESTFKGQAVQGSLTSR